MLFALLTFVAIVCTKFKVLLEYNTQIFLFGSDFQVPIVHRILMFLVLTTVVDSFTLANIKAQLP